MFPLHLSPLLRVLSCILPASFVSSCGFSSDDDDYRDYAERYGHYQPYLSDESPSYHDPYRVGSSTVQTTQEKVNSVTPALVMKRNGTTHSVRGHGPGPKRFRTVIIDAGHGGKDSGAHSGGVSEKILALDIAKRMQRQLSGSFKTVLIRRGDYFVELDNRVRKSKAYKNAILISIHLNHSTSSSNRGPETYYFRVDSYSLGKRIQKNLRAVAPVTKSRGLVRRRLRLTRNPEIPCVLLELGYLSNSADRKLLQKSSYREKLAGAISKAVRTQNSIGDAGMGKLPKPLDRPLSRSGDKSRL